MLFERESLIDQLVRGIVESEHDGPDILQPFLLCLLRLQNHLRK